MIPKGYTYNPLPKELSIKNGVLYTNESIEPVLLEECYTTIIAGSLLNAGAFRFLTFSNEPNCSLIQKGKKYIVSIDRPISYGEKLTINAPVGLDGWSAHAEAFFEVKLSSVDRMGLFLTGPASKIYTHIGKHRLWTGAFINDCGDSEPNAYLEKERDKLRLKITTAEVGDEILIDYSNAPCGFWKKEPEVKRRLQGSQKG